MFTDRQISQIMERLGDQATPEDAERVAAMAEAFAIEQGDTDFDLMDWIVNPTYDFTELWDAANGDAEALVRVRTEAGLKPL